MSADRLGPLVRRAIEAGLLPPRAALPAQPDRPWPVVLLTGIGAWLAVLPLLGVVSLLFGGLLVQAGAPYLIGITLLVGCPLLLRSPTLSLFLEQLTVPMLLAGGSLLTFALYRDLPVPLASAVLMAICVALALAVPQAWLRVLLGAAAAGCAFAMTMPARLDAIASAASASARAWLGLHVALLLWIGLQALLRTALLGGRWSRAAASVESLTTGWGCAVMAGLALWSGMTFLVGGALGTGPLGANAGLLQELHRQAEAVPSALPATSALLSAGAMLWVARAWPGSRRLASIGPAAVLPLLGWFLPSLGATLLMLAGCATTHRWRQAAAAGLAAGWVVGSFYYQLQWPLATKAAVVALAGALLGALACASVRKASTTEPAATGRAGGGVVAAAGWWRTAGIAAGTLLAVVASAFGIWQKEQLIAHGHPIYVELAPVDPRSLMQGDYMRLAFRLPTALRLDADGMVGGRRPTVVAQVDARGIATLRSDDGTGLQPGEQRIELTPRNGGWTFVSDAWYFKEGDGERWSKARYGEFRVGADGRALLVGMADSQLLPIRP